jgi:hypothetical protein
MRRIRSHLSYANVISSLCLFLLLTGGTAVALSGSNTVFTDDIANDTQPASGGNPAGGLVAPDLRAGSVGTSEAANNSLTGTDINESSLGEVPSATLGGLGGQSGGAAACDPETGGGLVRCDFVSVDLPAPSRLLIIGQIRAEPDTGNGNGGGSCQIGLGGTPSPVFVNGGQTDVIAIASVTGIVGPGPTPVSIQCNETASGIRFFDGQVSFVALSPH